MTDGAPSPQHIGDAGLLNLVRAGDSSAFDVLRLRHEGAARRLAREFVVSPAEIDDVVAETFGRVLDVLRRGGGPADAFRPYLLTALRRVCDDRTRVQRSQVAADARQLPDPGAPFIDPAVASLDNSLILEAFSSLPERWGAVLWHAEIERAMPAEVAPLFGLSRNSVTALRRRAIYGLGQAYLQLHLARIARPQCRQVVTRLGAFVGDALSARDGARVSEHLEFCADCRELCGELADPSAVLRAKVAPIFLGAAAASYLAAGGPDGTAGPEAGDPPGGVIPIEAGGRWRQAARRIKRSSRRQRLLATAVVVVLAAIVLGAYEIDATVRQSLPGQAAASAAHRGTASPSAGPGGATASTPTASPTASPTPSSTPSQSPSPVTSPPPPAPAVRLAATLSASSRSKKTAWADFTVTDAGQAPTGELTASIALAGGSFTGFSGQGWACQPTSAGAQCQHGPIPAGGQAGAQAEFRISISACGETVQLTITGAGASASVRSTLQCTGVG